MLHHFLPTLKLERQARRGTRIVRPQGVPQTPYVRMLAAVEVAAEEFRVRVAFADVLNRHVVEAVRAQQAGVEEIGGRRHVVDPGRNDSIEGRVTEPNSEEQAAGPFCRATRPTVESTGLRRNCGGFRAHGWTASCAQSGQVGRSTQNRLQRSGLEAPRLPRTAASLAARGLAAQSSANKKSRSVAVRLRAKPSSPRTSAMVCALRCWRSQIFSSTVPGAIRR